MVLRGETLKPPAVFVVTRRFETRTPKKIEKDFSFFFKKKKNTYSGGHFGEAFFALDFNYRPGVRQIFLQVLVAAGRWFT